MIAILFLIDLPIERYRLLQQPFQNLNIHIFGFLVRLLLSKHITHIEAENSFPPSSLDRRCFMFIESPKKVVGCRDGNRYVEGDLVTFG